MLAARRSCRLVPGRRCVHEEIIGCCIIGCCNGSLCGAVVGHECRRPRTARRAQTSADGGESSGNERRSLGLSDPIPDTGEPGCLGLRTRPLPPVRRPRWFERRLVPVRLPPSMARRVEGAGSGPPFEKARADHRRERCVRSRPREANLRTGRQASPLTSRGPACSGASARARRRAGRAPGHARAGILEFDGAADTALGHGLHHGGAEPLRLRRRHRRSVARVRARPRPG